MTREEATIKVLRGHIKSVEEIIEALEQEPLEVEATKLQKAYNKGFEDCRQAVLNQIFYSTDNSGDVVLGSVLRRRIENLPPVNPQEPKTGHWKPYLKEGLTDMCSECGSRFDRPWDYCPHCGCRMESEDKG